ncbi:putative papain-like cysteine peptidase superfamily [Helianthus anomalus]
MPGLLDGPTFQLLTQDVELGVDVNDTDNTETSVPPEVQKSDAMNQEDKHSKEEETKNTVNDKGISDSDITHKTWVTALESKRRKPFSRFNRSCDDLDDEMEICITSEEQRIWDFLFDVKYSIDVIFKSMYGVEITKTLMCRFREEVKVYSDVVDAWVDVMNYEEVDRTAGCETRIYFRTTVIDSWLLTDSTCDDTKRMKAFRERMMGAGAYELIGIKMLFFPILEDDQYYLIVFNLENDAITVIDHKPDCTPLVGIRDHQDYFNKDTPYKVKHMLVTYLECSEHPSKDQLEAAKIKRCYIHWATAAHPMDSAIILMQHMQNFNGANEPFECGFSSHWKRKQNQILALRKNSPYAYYSLM